MTNELQETSNLIKQTVSFCEAVLAFVKQFGKNVTVV